MKKSQRNSDSRWRMAETGWMKIIRDPTCLITFLIWFRFSGE